ncbi:MAG TPA: serine protease [Actinomycetota bacterium]
MSKAHAHPRRQLPRACRVGGLLALLAGLLLLPASRVQAGDPTPTTKAVTLASPGVVLISTAAEIPVHVTVAALQQPLHTSTVHGIRTGELQGGSGFVVNPKGTVVTASHVVSFDDKRLQQLKNYAVNQLFFDRLQRFHHEQPSGDPYQQQSLSDPVLDNLLQLCYAEVICQITPKPVVSVITPAQGEAGSSRTLSATIATSADFESTDITVLHADATGLPTAPLAQGTGDLQPGQPVIALGFPGSAEEMLKTGRTEPTPVFGLVSSMRARKHGSGQVVQVDVRLESGMSGGPVIGLDGKVIGLISFTGVERAAGGRTQGYLRTVDDIQDALSTVGVKAETGELDTVFAQAMNYLWTHHYSAAVPLYQRVLNLSDGHLLAKRFLTQAQAKADGPDDIPLPQQQAATTGQDSGGRMRVVALALLAVLVGALVVLLALPLVAWRQRPPRSRPVRRWAPRPAGWDTAAPASGAAEEPPAPAGEGLPIGDGQTVGAHLRGAAPTRPQDEAGPA